ncbi:MAG: ABC transporter permease subunit [Xanthomonadaceae bacterium]|nr:ABC transporter permease subunit [Xanthomonadaceae bacterium]
MRLKSGFFEILRFELRQQLKAPLFWVIAAVFGALAFALVSTDAVTVGGASGNVLRNAPLVIVRLLTVLSVLGMFLVTVFVAGAALRDFEQRTAELVFTTPISRGAYLGGRFAAGYLAALAIMLVCALGIALGGTMPWIDAMRLGPSSWHGYAWAFGVMVVPDMLFIAALLFLLATTTRSLLATYVGLIVFFVLQALVGLLSKDVNNHYVAALLDPFGGRTVALVTRYWSAYQSNRELPALSGVLLFNRLLWIGTSAAMLGATSALFRPNREGLQLPRRKPRAEPPILRPAAGTATPALPRVRLADNLRAHLLQLRTQFAFDTLGVLRGVPFLIMLVLGLTNLVASLFLSGHIYGTATYPVTHQVLEMLRGAFQWLLFIIVTFYAGELVWRERSQRSAEVSDAFPLPDWIPLVAKLGALLAVIAAFQLVGALVGIGWQLGHGYTHLEPGLYLATLALNAMPFVLLAALALFLQVLSNNKFLGYLLTILWFVAQIGFGLLHWDQNLYNYGNAPNVPYSDMNGFGHFLGATLWFDFYWANCAVVLLVLAALFWVRGTGQAWRDRLREARARLHAPAKATLALALLAFAGSGAWIYYNTNVLNHYRSSSTRLQQRADYEKKYAKYKDLPQPRITAVQADVDIHPYRRKLDIRGRYTLVNKHSVPISELYVNFADGFTVKSLDFAPHDTVSADKDLGFTIYRLKTPLAPGASMRFDFDLQYAPKGFTNSPEGTFLAHNGTFFNNQVMPQFGYQTRRQITDRNDRRKYGLGTAMPRMPKLGDEKARANTYISNDADWISFDTTVSTAADQTAVAPGYLQKEWTADGRRYFHYTSTQGGVDQPMLPFFAWLSARYAVKQVQWKGVQIGVYYNPAHAWNVDRMIQGAEDALDYYDAHYTPYQFRQLRILEFPDYAAFAQSFANTIPFSESIGFIADLRDPSKIDYPYYVTAHEVAHQWWAHRVIGADMQGSTMLSESLAQYSALMVMKHKYGADQMRKFLKYELDHYLAGRATEKLAEEPLAKVESDQRYIHYQKGSLVFYALQDYIGEDTVDRVLKQFLLDKGFQQPPYTTSREFMDALGKAVGPKWQPLLNDLFWKITLFDNRTTAATAKKLPDGRYQVTMQVHAGKVYVDGTGKETAARPDIPIEVGVFAASPGKGRDGKPLYLEKRMLPDGDSTITVTVDGRPAEAGIDPYNELIDKVSGDNRHTVTVQ